MAIASSKRVYNWYISLIAASCMVLYGYDASVYNSVQGSDNWVAWFNDPDDAAIGGVNTAYTVGAIIGGFFFAGPIADYFGRRVGMACGCVLVIIATFIQTFCPQGKLAAFLVGRCIIGVGQGVALTAGPIFIGECSPAHIRGKIMSFWQLFYSVGSFICFWINYACSKNTSHLGEWDWKTVVIFQLLVPVIILCLLFTINDTPRWYLKRHNNIDKARRALARIRDTPEQVEEELLQIRTAIEFEKEISTSYLALWKDKSVRKRLLLAFVINAGQQLTGQGSLNTYSTKIYEGVFTSKSTISLINALNATFGILFTLNAVWTVDRFGRKFLLIVGGIGMAICMVIVAAVEIGTPSVGPDDTKTHSVGIATVFLLFLFTFFYKPSWGATVWIWTSEVFSLNIRAQAVGMASQTQNVANAIFQQFFPQFLSNCGFSTFFFFAGINILLAAFVWFFIPETKQVALEQMDVLFGGQDHVEKGANILNIEEPHVEGRDMSKTGAHNVDEVEHVNATSETAEKA